MPELPEVETIARSLRDGGRCGESILGCHFARPGVLWERSIAMPGPVAFQARLPGQRVEWVDRRGKYLRLHLSKDVLLIHLRMSGDLRVESADLPPQPHDRILFPFQYGSRMAFNDPRKFGRVWLTKDPAGVLAGLGPEPFDAHLDAGLFYQRLHASRRQLKHRLLDQSFLGGVGNIYADEALHHARLPPLRRSHTLALEEAAALLAGVRAVLEAGIAANGASLDWVYRGGNFQNQFRVHLRAGEPCYNCGTLIVRQVVGQRSTYFCPVCQPADPSQEV